MATQEKEPCRRLIITRMELENFKSYAGVQHIGPFHKYFSAIVGPNGSGKSNVIDALLFVFGFKASKIRLKRVSELVHKSAKHPELQTARVTVHFSDILDMEGEEFEEVPNTQFCITRTAGIDNKSEYFISDKRSSFAEITTLLKGKGIDLDHNRFLILQGEVEAISLMPPKARNEHETGMLEYLEDIIGTCKYKSQIEDAERQRDELTEQREAILNLVKMSQKERDSLKGAKSEAETYLRTEADYIRVQSLNLQIVVANAAKRGEACQKNLDAVKATLATHQEGVQKLDKDLNAAESAWKSYKQELDKKEKAVKIAADALGKHERQRTELMENQKNTSKKVKKIQDGIKKDESALKLQQTTMEQSETQFKKLEAELEAGRPQLAKHEAELEKLTKTMQSELEPLRKILEKTKKEVMPFQQKLNQAESELQVAQSERELLVNKSEEASKKLETETAAYAALKEELSAKESEIEKWEKTKLKMATDFKQRQAKHSEVVHTRGTVQNQYRESFRKLEELKNTASADRNQSGVVEFLMRQKRNGTLPGVHGRLGDLGAINAKYDVAISTACPQLNYMVVEDTATGQKCLDMLRENNVGRCTVIILEKQQHLQSRANTPISTPEGHKRLYDLIEIKNDKFRVAFYWALYDTLVAKDIDSATRIAFAGNKRWRVVTEDGKLIETSGTMTGGGRPNKGLMSGKVRSEVDPKQLQQLEEQVAQLKQQQQSLIEEEDRLDQEIRAMQSEMDRSAEEQTRNQTLVKGKRQALADLEKRLQVLKKDASKSASAEDSKLLKDMDQKVAKYEKARDEVKASMQRMEEAVKEAESKMDDVGGTAFKSLKHKVKSATGELGDKERVLTELTVTIRRAKQNIAKMETKLAKDKAELTGTEKGAGSCNEKVDKLEKEYLKYKTAHAQLKAEFESFAGDGEEKRMAVAEKKKAKAALETKGVDLEHQRKQNEAEVNNLQAQIKKLDARINDLDEQLAKSIRQYGMDFLQGHTDEIEQSQSQRPVDDSEDAEPPAVVGQKRKNGPKVVLPPLAKRRNIDMSTRVDPEKLAGYHQPDLQTDVAYLHSTLERMSPNLQALLDWREKNADYQTKIEKLDKATQARADMAKKCESLKKQRLSEFMRAFQTITMKLKEMYQMLTLTGDADLELVDSLDPFSEGIIFSVRPHRKSWKQISNLSGGEKTLSSLALVFALHHFQPSPLYFLDEIDAALDFQNVSIVARYIQQQTSRQARCAQFIIISLRNNMFELANRLVGIYKTEDCTKSVAINPQAFGAPAGPAEA